MNAQAPQQNPQHTGKPQVSPAHCKIQPKQAVKAGGQKKTVRRQGVPGPERPEKFIENPQHSPQQTAEEKLSACRFRGHHCIRRLSQLPPRSCSS